MPISSHSWAASLISAVWEAPQTPSVAGAHQLCCCCRDWCGTSAGLLRDRCRDRCGIAAGTAAGLVRDRCRDRCRIAEGSLPGLVRDLCRDRCGTGAGPVRDRCGMRLRGAPSAGGCRKCQAARGSVPAPESGTPERRLGNGGTALPWRVSAALDPPGPLRAHPALHQRSHALPRGSRRTQRCSGAPQRRRGGSFTQENTVGSKSLGSCRLQGASLGTAFNIVKR